MLLNELFNQPLPWKWIDDYDGELVARFTTGKTAYLVSFVRHDHADEPADLWEVEFVIENAGYPKSVGVAGTGDAPAVFATVVNIIRTFLSIHRAIILVFSAKGASRIKLYDSMTKRLSNNVERIQGSGVVLYRIRN